MYRTLCVVGLIGFGIVVGAQQSGQQPAVTRAAQAKFVNLAVLPDCMTVAVERGDPSTNSSSVLVRLQPACDTRTHWHSADASVLAVGGSTQLEVKGGKTLSMQRGDFIYMPSRHIHGEKCIGSAPCTFFVELYGPFDVHYVDSAGKEIPMEEALKPSAKADH
jgi:quercetin dioxygenase-like cupin family protein